MNPDRRSFIATLLGTLVAPVIVPKAVIKAAAEPELFPLVIDLGGTCGTYQHDGAAYPQGVGFNYQMVTKAELEAYEKRWKNGR